MQQFLFVYRIDQTQPPVATPEQMQANTQKWMDWMESLAKQGKLADRGNRLDRSGKVVKPGDVVTNGPFTEIKESIGGYSIIQADSYDEAAEIAKGCPVFYTGGSVEIRLIDKM